MFVYRTEEELKGMTAEQRDSYAASKREYEKEEQSKAINTAVDPVKAMVNEMKEDLAVVKETGLKVISADKSFGEVFTEDISNAIKLNFDTVKGVGSSTKMAKVSTNKVVGNMSGATNITPANGVVQTYRSGVALGPDRKIHFRDLVRSVQSATGQYVFYRENTPAGEGAIAFQTTHLNPKSQIDYDYTKVTVNLEYLAGYARVARQMMEDLPWLMTALPEELLRDFYKQEDTEFYTTLSAAATAGVSAATAVAERVIDFVVQVEQADYTVNGIVVNPTDWGNILKTLPTGGSYSVPGGFSINPATGQIMIAGIPIYKATWVPADKVLVGDWTRAEIVQSTGLDVSFSYEDQNNFIINAVTAKVEQREGLAILRPNAFVFGDFGLVP